MIAIGERINGMFIDVKKAILEKDASIIHDLARRQSEAGAKFLDCNVGTAASDQEAAMRWLVGEIQNAVKTPIAVDSQKFDVVKAGVEACDAPMMINSVSGDPEKLRTYITYALEKDASLVTLTMDRRGVPQDVNTRVEIAATIVTTAMEMGLPMERLYIDPIIIPVNVAQDQPAKLLEQHTAAVVVVRVVGFRAELLGQPRHGSSRCPAGQPAGQPEPRNAQPHQEKRRAKPRLLDGRQLIRRRIRRVGGGEDDV